VRLHFETGSTALSSENQQIVTAVAQKMKDLPDLKVDISGFADKTGNVEQNLDLALRRATAVRDALKAAGVADDRMSLKKPEQVILGAGQDAEGRRVEIAVAKRRRSLPPNQRPRLRPVVRRRRPSSAAGSWRSLPTRWQRRRATAS
jgi:outer membrane protein OmpA-like peptidoglycan-associated protein